MIYQSREQALESILSLSIASQGSLTVTREQSRRNIADNIVLIGKVKNKTKNKATAGFKYTFECCGSGLQITQDGFTLTAAHVIRDWLEDWRTTDNSEEKYLVLQRRHNLICAAPLDISSCALDSNYDLAVVKAQIPDAPPLPIPFRLESDSQTYSMGRDLELLTRNTPNLGLTSIPGKILRSSVDFTTFDTSSTRIDAVETNIPAEKGMSGSPLISGDGTLVGIAIANRWIDHNPKEITGSFFAKSVYAVRLINVFVYESYGRIRSLT